MLQNESRGYGITATRVSGWVRLPVPESLERGSLSTLGKAHNVAPSLAVEQPERRSAARPEMGPHRWHHGGTNAIFLEENGLVSVSGFGLRKRRTCRAHDRA